MTEVLDHAAEHRLVVAGPDGSEAVLVYERSHDRLYLLHTEVPDAMRGQGTGSRLVASALGLARDEGLTVVPWCPFARRWLHGHLDVGDGVEVDWSTPPPTTGGRYRRG